MFLFSIFNICREYSELSFTRFLTLGYWYSNFGANIWSRDKTNDSVSEEVTRL